MLLFLALALVIFLAFALVIFLIRSTIATCATRSTIATCATRSANDTFVAGVSIFFIFTQATISRAIELADNEKDLIKLNHLIQVSQLRGSHIPDDKLSEWKSAHNELKTTIKAYQIVFNNSDKDTKNDFKTIIKQVKNEIKQLEKEQKEQNEKNTNSGKKGSDGGSDKKDNKSKSKKK